MSSSEWAAEEWNHIIWENEQMEMARLPADVKDLVRQMLNTWAAVPPQKRHVELVLETFEALVQGHALVIKDDPSERWEAAIPGRIHQRDTVRVKHDAYRDSTGAMHNGRRGRVIGVRYGDIIIKYEDGRHPPFDAVHHPPQALERLMR